MKIFLLALLGTIVGVIVVKNWRNIVASILIAITIILTIIISIPLFILSIPFRILNLFGVCKTEEQLKNELISLYDKVFFLDEDLNKIRKHEKKIRELEVKLENIRYENKENEGLKILKEAKWLL